MKKMIRLGLLLGVLALHSAPLAAQGPFSQITWTFDNLGRIGGLPVRVEGHPKVIDSPVGKAIEFNGVDDVIFLDKHPLAGATTFTFEAIFRPDGGAEEQRWFHLAERDPKTGLLANTTGATNEANARFLFEIRVVEGNQWYLDAFVNGGPGFSKTLMFRDKLHPTGHWYHVAQVYDGKMYRSYVNGELQGESELTYKPQGEGGSAIGARINKVTFFHGAVAKARFTPSALPVSEFMKLP
jgi:Concanavalin A-like lectin/glucanases superfamily